MHSIFRVFIFIICNVVLYAFPTPNITTFENGLTLVTVNDPSATVASSYVFVRTGSIFENKVLGSGASHYLEHLLAGGTTTKRSENDYRTLIDQFGGAYNAYTTYDHTGYYIHSSSDNLPTIINVLYEWMTEANWTTSEFNRERGVILKEIDRANNNISRKIYQKTQSLYYIDSPYKHPVIGYQPIFLNLSSENLKSYYETTYVPENMVVVIGGNISENAIINHVNQTFGNIPAKPGPIRYTNANTRVLSPSNSNIILDQLKTPRIILRYPIPSFFNTDVYPLDLLAYIFGNGQQSLFYQEFVVKQQLATKVSVSSITPAYDFGYFEISLETTKNASIVIDHVQNFIDRYKRTSIKNLSIRKAKQQKKNEYILGNTSLSNYIAEIGRSMMMGQNPLFLQFYSNNFSSISKSQLKHVINTYLNKNYRQSYVITNSAKKTNTMQQNLSNNATIISIKKGIDLITAPISNDDIVNITIHLKGGLQNETIAENGLGYLSTSLIGKSTRRHPRNKYQQLFENKGASIGASMQHNGLSYHLTCTTDDAQRLIPLFIQGLTEFSITEVTFNESKMQLLTAIKKKNESWFQESFDQLKTNLISPTSIYSMPLKGSKESVETLTKTMVENYIELQQQQAPIQIVIQSKSPDIFIPLIKKELNSLPTRQQYSELPLTLSKQTFFNNTISSPVGVVMTVLPLPKITTLKNYLTMQLIDAILSGMRYPSGLLHQRLRGSQLVYVVHTTHMKFSQQNMLFTYALTDGKNVKKTTAIIHQSISDIKSITDDQFDIAKSQVLFNFQDTRQNLTSSSRNLLLHHQLFGTIFYEKDIKKTLNSISIYDIHNYIVSNFNTHYIMEINWISEHPTSSNAKLTNISTKKP